MQKFRFSILLQTIKELLLTPVKFWKKNKSEVTGNLELFGYYFLLLVLASAIATFIGAWLSSSHFYMGIALNKAIKEVVVFSLQYFVSVYIVNQLMPVFGVEKKVEVAGKLVAYSFTPFLLTSIITGLFPVLYIVDILGFYGVYIFWTGVNELLDLPDDKRVSYIVVTAILNLFIFGIMVLLFLNLFRLFY